MRRETLTIQARYVFPVEGAPIEEGSVTIEGPRIGWLGPVKERMGDIDLGNVAIIPGFVNAHTHLELAPMADNGPPQGPVDELGWLKQVIQQRRGRTEESLTTRAAENVRASIEAGTTFLADTTTGGLSWEPVAEAPLRGGFRRGDRFTARPGPRDRRRGLEVAEFDPTRVSGGRLCPGGPESSCPI